MVWLDMTETPVTDLKVVKDIHFLHLAFPKSAVKDYAVLRGMSIDDLSCTIRTKNDLAPIRGIKGLRFLNGKDAQEQLK